MCFHWLRLQLQSGASNSFTTKAWARASQNKNRAIDGKRIDTRRQQQQPSTSLGALTLSRFRDTPACQVTSHVIRLFAIPRAIACWYSSVYGKFKVSITGGWACPPQGDFPEPRNECSLKFVILTIGTIREPEYWVGLSFSCDFLPLKYGNWTGVPVLAGVFISWAYSATQAFPYSMAMLFPLLWPSHKSWIYKSVIVLPHKSVSEFTQAWLRLTLSRETPQYQDLLQDLSWNEALLFKCILII